MSVADDPWLVLRDGAALAGGWVRMRYRTGLFDESIRPILRFTFDDGSSSRVPMTGAPLGVGEWVGRIPDRIRTIAISPVRKAGPFSFALDSASRISRLGLLQKGLRRDPRLALTALAARLIGWREEAQYCLKFAALAKPLTDYHDWLMARQRPFLLENFDAPKTDWQTGPALHLLMPDGDAQAQARTVASLRAQSFVRWTLHLISPRQRAGDDVRIRTVSPDRTWEALGIAPDDAVMGIAPGDLVLPHGVAALMEAFAADTKTMAAYGDEDAIAADGRLHSPRFLPDWSPLFEQQAGYVGSGMAVRRRALEALGLLRAADLPDAARHLTGTHEAVRHVRRLVWRRAHPGPLPKAPVAGPANQSLPSCAVVVPTRDHPELLKGCLEAVLDHTDYPGLNLVLVDNGTVEPEALALLADAGRDPRVTVIRAPGPFNYSALCNAGAAAATADLLAFFNNDVRVIDRDWLRRLAGWAARPQAGVVGAKLLYPDGRVQHGGDVMGLGETVKQNYRGALDGDGYLGQLVCAHEVLAVTGAVQVVSRARFQQAGGFDETLFPILFNDTDLCLRLHAQGFVNLLEPAARLIHLESASRGFTKRPLRHFAQARANLQERWGALIADDPYFHPALSLYGTSPSLG